MYKKSYSLIAELAEHSPIIIPNSSNPSSWKNLDLRPYDRTTAQPTVQDATFNMHGQLYRGHTIATALSSSLVVSALSSKSDNPGSSPGRGKALCPSDMREKKMWAPLLGLAKSIYYLSCTLCKMTNEWYTLTHIFHFIGYLYSTTFDESFFSENNSVSFIVLLNKQCPIEI